MTFSMIIMFIAGLVILDGVITYYTFRKTEKELAVLRTRLYSQGTDLCSLKSQADVDGPIVNTSVEHITAMKREIQSMRSTIRIACDDIEICNKRLAKSASMTDKVPAPRNNENQNNKHNKKKH